MGWLYVVVSCGWPCILAFFFWLFPFLWGLSVFLDSNVGLLSLWFFWGWFLSTILFLFIVLSVYFGWGALSSAYGFISCYGVVAALVDLLLLSRFGFSFILICALFFIVVFCFPLQIFSIATNLNLLQLCLPALLSVAASLLFF